MSYDEIAREVGNANRGTAWRTVSKALERNVVQSVEVLREVEGDRLDALQAAVWEQAMAGDLTACLTVLKIIERRIQILGLEQTADGAASVPRTLVVGSSGL